MPPRKENRAYVLLRLPKDWLLAIEVEAEREGIVRIGYVRKLISEGLARRKIDHSPDDYGVFVRNWRMPKDERLRRRKAEYNRRYKEKQRLKALAADKPDGILWTFHPSGQITTSDLDLLATFVGIIDASGTFQPESTRYSKDRVIAELRKAFADRDFPDPRYRAFLDREGG